MGALGFALVEVVVSCWLFHLDILSTATAVGFVACLHGGFIHTLHV